MLLSRPFRALLRLTALWAIPWSLLGVGVGLTRWLLSPDLRSGSGSLSSWLLNHFLGYTALGVLSGLYLGLLAAWLSGSRHTTGLSRRRLLAWSAVAGAAPAVLFLALGLLFQAPSAVLFPLLGLGALGSGASAFLATTTRKALTATSPVTAALRPHQ